MHACSSNAYREFKYWWPVYIWITRKRVDQVYKMYLIRFYEKLIEIEDGIEKARIQARKDDLKEDKKQLLRKKVSHFDFIEDCAAYHIIQVRMPCLSPAIRCRMLWQCALQRYCNAGCLPYDDSGAFAATGAIIFA